MGWFDIAGGASRGYVQGQEDEQRRQEFLALQNQRKRLEKQQKEDDALSETYKAVRPAGDYDEVTYGAGTSDPTQLGAGAAAPARSTTKKVKRTAADVAREQAGVLETGGGLRHIQTAAALRQQAYQTEQADRAERDAQKREALTNIGQAIATGNVFGAARLIQDGYKKHVPDGHELVIEDKNGVPHWAVAGPNGKFIEPLQPITMQSVKQRYDQGVAMLTPELSMQDRKLGIEQYGAESGRMSAEAAQQNAATAAQKAYWETIGAGGTAELAKRASEDAYLRAHAAYYNAKAGQEREAANATTYGTPINMYDATGAPAFGVPTKKGVGPPEITPLNAPPGWKFSTPRKEMNDVQSKAFDKIWAMEQNGEFAGKGGKLRRDQLIMSVPGLSDHMALDPVTQKLIAGDPKPGEKPGEKPGAVATPAEDTTRYLRSRTPRGWEYSLTTRGGKTKAEWAAEDAKASGK